MIRLVYTPPALDPWERIERVFPPVIRKSLEHALAVGMAAARKTMTPSGPGPRIKSGRLACSLGWRVYRQGDLYIGELFAGAPYAAAQEYGATVQAHKARYLKFRVQGRWVQVKRVELPARPYLRPGRDAALQALPEILQRNLREVMP